MSLVKDRDVEDALAILANEDGAAARAAHEYMSDLTKVVLAQLMQQSNETTEAGKLRWAQTQTEYADHLKKVEQFAKESYRWRQRYSAAEAKIEIWRTQAANIRAAERVR